MLAMPPRSEPIRLLPRAAARFGSSAHSCTNTTPEKKTGRARKAPPAAMRVANGKDGEPEADERPTRDGWPPPGGDEVGQQDHGEHRAHDIGVDLPGRAVEESGPADG